MWRKSRQACTWSADTAHCRLTDPESISAVSSCGKVNTLISCGADFTSDIAAASARANYLWLNQVMQSVGFDAFPNLGYPIGTIKLRSPPGSHRE